MIISYTGAIALIILNKSVWINTLTAISVFKNIYCVEIMITHKFKNINYKMRMGGEICNACTMDGRCNW